MFRYCHTSSEYVFFGLLRPSQFRAVALSLLLLGFLAGLFAVNQTVMSSADVKKMLAERNPELFEIVRDRTILGIKVRKMSKIIMVIRLLWGGNPVK